MRSASLVVDGISGLGRGFCESYSGRHGARSTVKRVRYILVVIGHLVHQQQAAVAVGNLRETNAREISGELLLNAYLPTSVLEIYQKIPVPESRIPVPLLSNV